MRKLVVLGLAWATGWGGLFGDQNRVEGGEGAPPAAEAAAAESPAPQESPAAADFDTRYRQWRATLAELIQVRQKFLDAPPAERGELRQQMAALVEQGEQLLPGLIAAAERDFLADPEAKGEAADFLVEVVRDRIRRDDYEPAGRLAQLLLDHDVASPQLDLLAGIAAFVTNQFDVAAARLAAAQKAGTLGPKAAEMQSNLDYYRDAWAAEQKLRAAEAEADDLPRVKLTTSQGDIVLELFENEAPQTVGNFVNLVEKKFYDGLSFHRVLPGFMAQGGCPQGDGRGGPGYQIPCECHQEGYRRHFRGSLSMAHAGRDTGGSQFFLTFVPTKHLDGKHTAFGRVIEGMDVLSRLHRRDPQDPHAPAPDKILRAEVLRKRDHDYQPTIVGGG